MELLLDKIKNKFRRLLYTFVLSKFGFGNRVSKSIWEKQFGGKDWDYLYAEAEKDHYLAIVDLFKKYGSDKVLDVGCGQGVLYHYIKAAEAGPLNYLGIDISGNAVRKAKASFPETNFQQLDFDYQKLEGKFDVIIFNETLYYFNRPLSIIQKCIDENLNNGGYFIISMCDFTGHEVIWQKLKQRYHFLSIEEIINLNQQKWKIGCFKP
ncbi:2-polyprenyl-3-methyl-5-hydroxy-6-metoxy-1,4-benzoquinol methylase [Pedobacter sp. AK013]|uniref:class I SAM-dependent methyltransferase n=1 Tax=Pedobacter sp. AK013 TaxID=2723071 RepID=UPI00161A803A|nr:methyltransferase domain-containing protein [Pedobacter sp. AK013]MBB6235514.1 2-polyprenyl-3-methyl-5-hydroxy-6-metoxy-1,4-benzoquinol methylase [Pedobacter sp. AK013]